VLITGESGTGKELVAKAIHNTGCRRDKPFIVVNCGGIPENLLESELFGHVKGAFTGAAHEKKGLFAMADKGTIFLDEIGELPMLLQAKLLRVTQQKSFIPVGATKPVHVDTRILAATNRDLEQEVINKNFREDLFYRLNVIQIKIPPLRERPEDIPLLVQYFMEKYSYDETSLQGVSNYAIEALQHYPFPGNVRELENIIERSIALSTSTLLLPESLSLARHKAGNGEKQPVSVEPHALSHEIPDEGIDLDEYLGKIEKNLLLGALEKSGGNKTEAARLLKINFRSFRYRLSKFGL
jgi:two-component system response regulator PilR (NtrC family)